jgi:hypothetical protein
MERANRFATLRERCNSQVLGADPNFLAHHFLVETDRGWIEFEDVRCFKIL